MKKAVLSLLLFQLCSIFTYTSDVTLHDVLFKEFKSRIHEAIEIGNKLPYNESNTCLQGYYRLKTMLDTQMTLKNELCILHISPNIVDKLHTLMHDIFQTDSVKQAYKKAQEANTEQTWKAFQKEAYYQTALILEAETSIRLPHLLRTPCNTIQEGTQMFLSSNASMNKHDLDTLLAGLILIFVVKELQLSPALMQE